MPWALLAMAAAQTIGTFLGGKAQEKAIREAEMQSAEQNVANRNLQNEEELRKLSGGDTTILGGKRKNKKPSDIVAEQGSILTDSNQLNSILGG